MREVVLTLREEEKYQTIKRLVDTRGNKQRAMVRLNLGIRQINRLIVGYEVDGKAHFMHGNRDRKPSHAISESIKDEIEDLYSSKYYDCTYTLFTEILAEKENINLSIAEVGQILRSRDLFSPKTRKITKKRAKKRLEEEMKKTHKKVEIREIERKIVAIEDAHPHQPRCIYFGEEVQIDASHHLWFGDTKTHLHAAIDDSTGTVLGGYFDKQETLNGYYNIYYQILKKYGIPYLFKADKRTVFEYKRKGTTSDEDNTFTQFAYASKILGTSIKTSSTPEFKPRIERLFGTLQNRLNVALRLANVTTIEEANAFLPAFFDQYNSKFALPIDNNKSVFEKQPTEQEINLTLAVLSRRTIDGGHAITFKNKYYKTVNSLETPIYFGKGTKCIVIETFDKSLYTTIENNVFALKEIPKFQLGSFDFDAFVEEKPKKIYIPNMMHPWKKNSFDKFIEKQNWNSDTEIC